MLKTSPSTRCTSCPSQWINHTKNLVKKNFNDDSKIVVIEGGSTRNETIMNSIRYIEKEYGLDER